MAAKDGACFSCGARVRADNFQRSHSCDACGNDTKVCKNCAHYDPRSRGACREDRAEPVSDAEKANFCEWFTPAPAGRSAAADGGAKGDAAKAAFDALFKKKDG